MCIRDSSSPESANGAVGGGILDLFSSGYFERQGNLYNAPGTVPSFGAPEGLGASGGVVSDYTTTPGAVYRAHIFTSTGTLVVDSIGSYGTNLEYLVVAGGGGGGYGSNAHSGGGGAGGWCRRSRPGGHAL